VVAVTSTIAAELASATGCTTIISWGETLILFQLIQDYKLFQQNGDPNTLNTKYTLQQKERSK
jgi:hypothetical protein